MSEFCFEILPDEEKLAFSRIPDKAQLAARAKLAALRRIRKAGGTLVAAQEEERRAVGQSGFSAKRLLNLLKDYLNGTDNFDAGDWRIVVNKSVAISLSKSERATVPFEFKEHFRKRIGDCRGNVKKARRELLAAWYAGDDIPGYGRWYEFWQRTRKGEPLPSAVCDPPPGWSLQSLNRLRPSDRFEIELVNKGLSAAVKTLRPIRLTRADIQFMERVEYDDHDTDFLIMEADVPCPLKGLFSYDVCTATYPFFGMRPGIKRDDGTRTHLKRRDLRQLMAWNLLYVGYPVDYKSEYITEHGFQASLTPADMAAVEMVTDGMVSVSQTGLIAGTAMPGGYSDKTVGNPDGKPYIESSFRLLEEYCKSVKGHKGRRYDLAPSELEARKKEAVALARAAALMPPHLRLEFNLPFEDTRQALATMTDIINQIHRRHDHQHEAFEKIRFFRRSEADGDRWIPFALFPTIDAAEREDILRRANSEKLFTSRMESPFERLARMSKGVRLKKIHESQAHRLLDEHRFVKVQSGDIAFNYDGQELVYHDPDSRLMQEGAEYLAFFHPYDLNVIYLTDADPDKKTYCGKLPRVFRGSRKSAAERKVRIAAKQAELNKRLQLVEDRYGDRAEQREADLDAHLVAVSRALEPTRVTINDVVPADTAPEVVADLTRAMHARDAERKREAAAKEVDVVGSLIRERK